MAQRVVTRHVFKAQVPTAAYKVMQRSDSSWPYTVRSESRCALRLRYVDLVVSIEVTGEVCCCFTVFSC
jgi:hypothetical protein